MIIAYFLLKDISAIFYVLKLNWIENGWVISSFNFDNDILIINNAAIENINIKLSDSTFTDH